MNIELYCTQNKNITNGINDMYNINILIKSRKETVFKGRINDLLFHSNSRLPTHVLLEGIEEYTNESYVLPIKNKENE